ncbi:MAG: helix-turn-helix transcriptional regulator [Planctomycetales bacterium]|nr:helix-turn-helix transcriptional regulator [Planctomycetales bacterium]
MTNKKKAKSGSDSPTANIAANLRAARVAAELTLEELATRSKISKTYLWELENDEEGQKKPSADILLKLAKELGTTIADLLGLPAVQVDKKKVEISPSLAEFRELMKSLGTPLSQEDLQALALTRFRGGQPHTKEGWFDLYGTLKRTTGRE